MFVVSIQCKQDKLQGVNILVRNQIHIRYEEPAKLNRNVALRAL
jgi:hypothetical protein